MNSFISHRVRALQLPSEAGKNFSLKFKYCRGSYSMNELKLQGSELGELEYKGCVIEMNFVLPVCKHTFVSHLKNMIKYVILK